MKTTHLGAALLGAATLLAACGDDDDLTTPPIITPIAGPGGAGPGTTTSAMGGQGGAGAAGGGGAGGAPAATCLAPTVHEAVFTLSAPEICVLGVYTADFGVVSYAPPTWGRHGGPMVLTAPFAAPYEVTVTRYVAPSTAEGPLSVESTQGPVEVGSEVDDADGAFFNGTAVDLPGTTWTTVSWAGSFPSTRGGVIALDGATVADSWGAVAFFGSAAVGAAGATRLLHTGLSPLEGNSAGPTGLYATDFCGATLCDPPTATIESWGDASGPVAIDALGNAFAVQTSFGGDQTLHGYAASAVEPEAAGNVAGTPLWTGAGFGSSLAALAPAGGDPGIVMYQPQTFDAENNVVVEGAVVSIRYTVDGGSLVAGDASAALVLSEAGTPVTLTGDDEGRVWVGVAEDPQASTFYVVGRRP